MGAVADLSLRWLALSVAGSFIFFFTGQMVRIPVPGEEMPPLVDDDIYNYSLSFLRVAMDCFSLMI